MEVPSRPAADRTADGEDIESAAAAAVRRRDLACGDRDRDSRRHCSGPAAADPVDHRDRPVGRTRPDTAAGASNCPANVVNTAVAAAATEDCVVVVDTGTSDRAFPARRDLVPSCSRRRAACAADVAAVASDSLELPCRAAAAAAAVVGVDLAGDHRKEDDSGTQLSNDPAAAAAGLDYYYYYLIDSVLAAAADLELGSDYWRAAVASVNFADQLPAT